MSLKLDNETWEYFAQLETLKKIEEVDIVRDLFMEDIMTIFSDLLTSRLRDCARKHLNWEFQRSLLGDERYWAMVSREGVKTVRVEFAYTPEKKVEWKLPIYPWIGIWTDATRTRKMEIKQLTSAFFSRSEEEGEYPIFEMVEPWPTVGDWQGLHVLTHDRCESMVDEIARQMASIVSALDRQLAHATRRPAATRRKGKQRLKENG